MRRIPLMAALALLVCACSKEGDAPVAMPQSPEENGRVSLPVYLPGQINVYFDDAMVALLENGADAPEVRTKAPGLEEAMEELGVETGMDTRKSRESFVEDCSIETDQPAMIPDSYLDVTAEKIRIYKQLDSMRSEKEVDRMRAQIEDRFGKLPPELENLFQVVKVRNLGARLGFEKIIIKNGLFICFFISNQMSPYFKSPVFSKVLERITANDKLFTLKQSEGKLKIVARGVDSMQKAWTVLNKLQ